MKYLFALLFSLAGQALAADTITLLPTPGFGTAKQFHNIVNKKLSGLNVNLSPSNPPVEGATAVEFFRMDKGKLVFTCKAEAMPEVKNAKGFNAAGPMTCSDGKARTLSLDYSAGSVKSADGKTSVTSWKLLGGAVR